MHAFPNWAKNILFLLVYMISGLVLAIIIEGLLSGTELIPLNVAIEQGVAAIRTPILTNTMVFITNMGSPFVLSSIACLIAAVFVLRGRNYDALLFITAMTVAIISFTVLKNTFQVSRPPSSLLGSTGWSFPSGHATVATAFFFTLAHAFFHRAGTVAKRTLLAVGSISGVLLISLTRLYLGAHWALDVLAGIALGLLSVSFTILVFSVFLENSRWRKNRMDL